MFGLAVLAYDIWRRLPPARRRQLLGLARRHGPTLLRSYKARRSGGD